MQLTTGSDCRRTSEAIAAIAIEPHDKEPFIGAVNHRDMIIELAC